jgi:hypothetical protein
MDYSALHKGYKCPHLPTQRLYVSRHVKFNKNYFFFAHITPISSPPTIPPCSTPLTILPLHPPATQQPISPPTMSHCPTNHNLPSPVQTPIPVHSMIIRS